MSDLIEIRSQDETESIIRQYFERLTIAEVHERLSCVPNRLSAGPRSRLLDLQSDLNAYDCQTSVQNAYPFLAQLLVRLLYEGQCPIRNLIGNGDYGILFSIHCNVRYGAANDYYVAYIESMVNDRFKGDYDKAYQFVKVLSSLALLVEPEIIEAVVIDRNVAQRVCKLRNSELKEGR